MITLLLAGLTAAALVLGAPWWLSLGLGLPALMLSQGLPWASLLTEWSGQGTQATQAAAPSRLQLGLDAAWIAMAWTWLQVALVRELGLRGQAEALGLLAACTVVALLGAALLRRARRLRPQQGSQQGSQQGAQHRARRILSHGERLGSGAVLVAVLLSALWRHGDLVRPLDGYWWLTDAAQEGHPTLTVGAGPEWAQITPLGWPESGALRLDPPINPTSASGRPHEPFRGTIVASEATSGRLILAVRGSIGSQISVAGQTATVQRSPLEAGEDGPVRRYLNKGVAALAVPVDLFAGQSLAVELTGDSLYLLPGTEAVWSAHASGELRYTHYWQILNQVENLDWAAEVLDWRWFTLNQPPGWSPLLATSLLLGGTDLPANNMLFLWVIGLVGLSAVRVAALAAPDAPAPAWLLPAGMVATLALLMFEPGSTNFPDTLYAAALVGVTGALLAGRRGWFIALAIASGLLRWPGVIVSTLAALCAVFTLGLRPWQALGRLWLLVGVTAALAVAVVLSGGLSDLPFILYFETFPEHWHGQGKLALLLPRVPEFFWIWTRYTGGCLLGAAVISFWPQQVPATHPSLAHARRASRFLVSTALVYSLMLCTIDHHPTHYFLPLVALTAPAAVAAAGSLSRRALAWTLASLGLLGLWTTLWIAQVF